MAEATTLKDQFVTTLLPQVQKTLGEKNVNALPKLSKIIINVGIGKFKEDKKMVQEIFENVTAIAGQKPILKKSKKAISNFKLRAGMPIGVKVTIRGDRMYHFLNKFINVICPRIRDFRGFSEKSFDGQGNISVGVKEHTVFPEVNPVDSNHIHGVQITIHTTAKDDMAATELLKSFKFPFRK